MVEVARADEIAPGTIVPLELGEQEIALARIGDDFYAVQGRCPHLSGPLGKGRLRECVLSCPWHGWQYDVRDGFNEFDGAIRLRTYEVRVEDGRVFVAL